MWDRGCEIELRLFENFIFGPAGSLLLHMVFLFATSGVYSLTVSCRLLIAVASLAGEHGL